LVEKQGENEDYTASYLQLVAELRHNGLLEESEDALRLALDYAPDHPEALMGLACALYREGRQDEATATVARVLDVDLTGTPLTNGLMATSVDLVERLRQQGCPAQADSVIEKIIAHEPENALLHRQYGLLLIKSGEYRYGWRERDKRLSSFPQPAWDGGPLAGKTILVQAMHGFGDAIQFLRFLPQLKARGARVILEHQPALATLLQGVEGWDRLVARRTGHEVEGVDFDLHLPLMSLPVPLNIEDRIPAPIPYIAPDPARVARWQERLASDPGPTPPGNGQGLPRGGESGARRLKVGLIWAGNPEYRGDAERSCRLEDYAPLARLPHVQYYSLQKGPAAEQALCPPAGMPFIDLSGELHDFADTAAVLMNLDLVITVDTAVAHLAGALGRPVWTLVAYHGCWRWMYERADTPWYPTMRLFRQREQGEWSVVMHRLRCELEHYQPAS
jgi:hypothetical protein